MTGPETPFNEKIITFSSNGYTLKGVLHLPAAERPPVIIGSHGLFSSGESPKQIALAAHCNAFGIAYFRFDHRGCGSSEGDFSKVTSLDARCSDLLCAVQTVQALPETGNRLGLFGSSFGGAVSMSAAAEIKPRAVVTIAAPIRSNTLKAEYDRLKKIDDRLSSMNRQQLAFDISDKITGLSNILLFHGDADIVVPVSNAFDIYERAEEPKKIIIQENGDHPMSNQSHQEQFAEESIGWYRTFLLKQSP